MLRIYIYLIIYAWITKRAVRLSSVVVRPGCKTLKWNYKRQWQTFAGLLEGFSKFNRGLRLEHQNPPSSPSSSSSPFSSPSSFCSSPQHVRALVLGGWWELEGMGYVGENCPIVELHNERFAYNLSFNSGNLFKGRQKEERDRHTFTHTHTHTTWLTKTRPMAEQIHNSYLCKSELNNWCEEMNFLSVYFFPSVCQYYFGKSW